MAASNCLIIAVWYTLFTYIGSAMHLWLLCENKNKFVLIFCAMGAGGNFIVNYLLIPHFGISGAAFATFLTQCLANLIFPLCFKDTREYAINVIKAMFLKDIHIKELFGFVRAKLVRKK